MTDEGSAPRNSGRPRTRERQRPQLFPTRRRPRGATSAEAVGEHGAALAVEVARHDVERLDQPGGDGAELVLADADAGVGARAGRASEIEGQRTDGRARRCRPRVATRSGRKARGAPREAPGPPRPARTAPGRRGLRRRCVCSIARSSAASPPGRMKWWLRRPRRASRSAAGRSARPRPPRSRTPRTRARTSPSPIWLPLDAAGFAPSTSRCWVRSMSGTGSARASP